MPQLSRPLARALTAALATVALVAAAPSAASAQAAPCTPIQLIDARGTSEPGPLGVIVGDPVAAALEAEFPGKVSTYAVDYPATGYATSSQDGNQDLVDHYLAQRKACPNQSFVLAGYSQGANVVQMSMGTSAEGVVVGGASVAKIPVAETFQISAVLLFGNPLRKVGRQDAGVVQNRTFDFCQPGDIICDPAGESFNPHFLYGMDIPQAIEQASDFLRRACTGMLGAYKGCVGAL